MRSLAVPRVFTRNVLIAVSAISFVPMMMQGVALAGAPVQSPAGRTVHCGSGGDLQAAIDAAAPGTTILVTGTCVGSFGLDKQLTLKSTTGAVLQGDGGSTLTVGQQADAAVIGLTFTGGGNLGGQGGGIANAGSLTVAARP